MLLKTVHPFVGKPARELRAAAEADDRDLVSVLAGLMDARHRPRAGEPPAGLAYWLASRTQQPGHAICSVSKPLKTYS
jgi:hypothetical protein